MKLLDVIKDSVVCLLDNEVYHIVKKTQLDEFIPIIDINDNVDVFYDSRCISYTYRPYNDTYEYTKVSVYHDGDVVVFHNPDGGIRSGKYSYFKTCSTEEDLFMLSTVQDNYDISVSEIKLFKQIWEMYF